MIIRPHENRSGIALIIVMVIVVVFAILAGGLSYSMKVETKLARNSSWDTELEWLGRSGIELAKFVLSQRGPGQQYDALNQKWAGGTGETNDALADISLTDNELGHGRFSVKIKDSDSKFNINRAVSPPGTPGSSEVVNQGLILIGVDGAEAPRIVNAIADWIDRDDETRVGSTDTESDYYMSLQPPYRAKNGPIDDLTELMMIKGITPAMYYGSSGGAVAPAGLRTANQFNRRLGGEEPAYPVGFVDLFTTISGPTININTASATVLQLIPDVDGSMAQAIITARAGADGTEGNEDDMPFHNVGEVQNAGIPGEIAKMFSKYFGVQSSTFEVEVETEIDAVKRTYFALLRRDGNRLVTLYMYWR